MYPAIETERNARRTNSTRMMRSFKGSPHHVQAPVDAQDLPGDVGGLRGSEKPDGGCDLLRGPQPLEGDPPLHRPDDLLPRPPPASIPSRATRVPCTTPIRLIPTTLSQSEGVVERNGMIRSHPALFTQTSSLPNSSRTLAPASRTRLQG